VRRDGWPGASLALTPGLYPVEVSAVKTPSPDLKRKARTTTGYFSFSFGLFCDSSFLASGATRSASCNAQEQVQPAFMSKFGRKSDVLENDGKCETVSIAA
jgi:hypothetical protein